MSPLALISLALSITESLLSGLSTNLAWAKVASEVAAAVDALTRAHNEVVTRDELEALRVKPQW